MSLKLKIKKLARMSPQEIYFRTSERVRMREERKAYLAEVADYGRDDHDFFAPEYAHCFQMLQSGDISGLLHQKSWMRKMPVGLSLEKAAVFKERYTQETANSLRRADAFLEHKFEFLGITVDYGPEIDWKRDPASRRPFPDGFYRDIEIFRNQNGIDIKHVWEINRLQFLIELAKAWYLTGEDKYQAEIDAVVAHWFRSNPYKMGVAWASALEVGVRAHSLFWVLNFYLARGYPNPRTVLLLLKLLYWSARYVRENLSLYFSPYNHLIGEAAALFLVGYQFPGFAGAAAWETEGWEILVEQIEKQFHPDGGTVEQATFYHHFTLGFYLQALNAHRLNGDAIPEHVLARVEKALEFALLLTRPDGTLPWIGDIDSARSIYFSHPAHWDFRGLQAIGAVWFERPDMKFMAGKYREEAFWLLPIEAMQAFAALPVRPPRRRQTAWHLPHSGYSVFRSGWNGSDHFSFIDCGEIAAGLYHDGTPSAAHGHADLLSIEIAPFGESLLIDPGFSNYRGDADWHAYFRSTAAHNTLEIGGASQARQVGILNWAHAPKFNRLQEFDGSFAAGLCGEHYGYTGLPQNPVHRRYFLFVDQTFWLSFDCVLPAEKPREQVALDFRMHFHFNAHVKLETGDGGQALLARGRTGNLSIQHLLASGQRPELEIRCGGEAPQDGWISPTYRQRQPAPVAVYTHRQAPPLYWFTLYLPSLGDDAIVKLVERTDRHFLVQFADRSYKIMLQVEDESAGESIACAGRAVILQCEDKKALVLEPEAAPRRQNGVDESKFLPIFEIDYDCED